MRPILPSVSVTAITTVVAGCGLHPGSTSVSNSFAGHHSGAALRQVSFGIYSLALPRGWDAGRIAGATVGTLPQIAITSYAGTPHPSHPYCANGRGLSNCVPAGGAAIVLRTYGRWHHNGRAQSFPRLDSPPPLLARNAGPIEVIGRGYGLSFRRDGWKLLLQIAAGGGRMRPKVRNQVRSLVEILRVRSWNSSTRIGALRLNRPPYLGIACGEANSKSSARHCNRVGIAVWPHQRLKTISASIGGNQTRLHRVGGAYWAGYFHPAGLRRGALALPRGGGDKWIGKPPVSAVVRLRALGADGRQLTVRRRVYLTPGFS